MNEVKCRCGQKITKESLDKCLICGMPISKELKEKATKKEENK